MAAFISRTTGSAALDTSSGPDRTVIRLGLDAQNAIRRARGEAELGPDGQPLPPEDEGTASNGSAASGNGKNKSGTKPAA